MKKILKNKTLVMILSITIAALFFGTMMTGVVANNELDAKIARDTSSESLAASNVAISNNELTNTKTVTTDNGDPETPGDDDDDDVQTTDYGDPETPGDDDDDASLVTAVEKEQIVKQAIINDLEIINGKIVTISNSEILVNIEDIELEAKLMVSEAIAAGKLDAVYLQVSGNGAQTTGLLGCLAASAIFHFPAWMCFFSTMTNNNQDYSVQTVSQTTLSDVISEEETEDCAICAQRASESLKQSRLAEVQDRLTESQAMAAVQDIQAGIEFYHNTYSKLSNSEKAALINNLVNQYQDYLNEEQVSVASLYAQALIEVDTVQSADTMAREAVDPGDINSVSGCFGKGVNMNNPDDNDDSWFQQFIDWLDQFGGLGDMFGAFMDFYDDNNNDPDDGSEPNNRLSGLGYFIINMINCLGDMLNDGCNTMGLNAASPQSQQIVMSALVLQQNQAMTQQYGQSAAQQGVQQSAAQETTTVQTQSQTISTSGSSAL